jgi:gamma-glutamyltranspeptidase/glutathione hydrolase
VTLVPAYTTYAPTAMAATVDGLATSAALEILRRGGSAVDAAIAANAVLTITLPNQCGLGGDLFALVQRPGQTPRLLEAAGAAGTGTDADLLRARGLSVVPPDELASVTVPGCVDGWSALHAAYGVLPLADVLAPAIHYGRDGFPTSPFLAKTLFGRRRVLAHMDGVEDEVSPGQILRRPEAAQILADIADGGRDGFYLGRFGRALMELGAGLFSGSDLRNVSAKWTEPLAVTAFGHKLWSTQPPAAGYLTLGAAWIADQLGLPDDPDDPAWAHFLIEATRQASFDRSDVLFDGADGAQLVSPERLRPRRDAVSADRAAHLGDDYRPGGTTFIAVVGPDGTAVSMIQSNCMSFGSGLIPDGTGIWLQNRGIGFDLRPGHPNELRSGRRPAHTLAPVLVTDEANGFRACVGTRGGDSQPQVTLQLLARILRTGQSPGEALAAGRWILRGEHDDTSFNTWGSAGRVRVGLEGNASNAWNAGLQAARHRVEIEGSFSHAFGHAHIVTSDGKTLVGASDPRSGSAATGGY